MSFLIKILFTALVIFILGGAAFLSFKDVTVPQETVTKSLDSERFLDDA